jgi:amino acid permease
MYKNKKGEICVKQLQETLCLNDFQFLLLIMFTISIIFFVPTIAKIILEKNSLNSYLRDNIEQAEKIFKIENTTLSLWAGIILLITMIFITIIQSIKPQIKGDGMMVELITTLVEAITAIVVIALYKISKKKKSNIIDAKDTEIIEAKLAHIKDTGTRMIRNRMFYPIYKISIDGRVKYYKSKGVLQKQEIEENKLLYINRKKKKIVEW